MSQQSAAPCSHLDVQVLIVGAGVSGIGAAIQLQKSGIVSFQLLEKSPDLGGEPLQPVHRYATCGMCQAHGERTSTRALLSTYPWLRTATHSRQISPGHTPQLPIVPQLPVAPQLPVVELVTAVLTGLQVSHVCTR